MKELTYEEYRELATENVCAVTIYGDFIKAFGWIEEWNDGFELFENDPFRIVLFERDMIGNEWFISHNASEEIEFINAIASTTDCHLGGMCYVHEEDRDERNVFEEFYSIFASHCDEKPKIIQLFRNEIIDFLQSAIGAYIIVEANWTFARCRGKTDLIGVGGYIVVREDGEVLCYHLFNHNEFEDYLLTNTKFETSSLKRHDYGMIYK